MALLVLFSTFSFTIESHYCGDVLVDTSLFGDVKTCGMEINQVATSSECSLIKKDCCNDEKLVIDGQDDLKTSFNKLDVEQQLFVASFIYSYINLFIEDRLNTTPFKDYSPPLIVKKIHVLDGVFLI